MRNSTYIILLVVAGFSTIPSTAIVFGSGNRPLPDREKLKKATEERVAAERAAAERAAAESRAAEQRQAEERRARQENHFQIPPPPISREQRIQYEQLPPNERAQYVDNFAEEYAKKRLEALTPEQRERAIRREREFQKKRQVQKIPPSPAQQRLEEVRRTQERERRIQEQNQNPIQRIPTQEEMLQHLQQSIQTRAEERFRELLRESPINENRSQ